MDRMIITTTGRLSRLKHNLDDGPVPKMDIDTFTMPYGITFITGPKRSGKSKVGMAIVRSLCWKRRGPLAMRAAVQAESYRRLKTLRFIQRIHESGDNAGAADFGALFTMLSHRISNPDVRQEVSALGVEFTRVAGDSTATILTMSDHFIDSNDIHDFANYIYETAEQAMALANSPLLRYESEGQEYEPDPNWLILSAERDTGAKPILTFTGGLHNEHIYYIEYHDILFAIFSWFSIVHTVSWAPEIYQIKRIVSLGSLVRGMPADLIAGTALINAQLIREAGLVLAESRDDYEDENHKAAGSQRVYLPLTVGLSKDHRIDDDCTRLKPYWGDLADHSKFFSHIGMLISDYEKQIRDAKIVVHDGVPSFKEHNEPTGSKFTKGDY